ncbi:MAG: leucine-rich repeat domain-containing protein [Oligoflexia bacterium]|nr:leucine-rich repeat domain-containing protein [Oligoflexia bacterium]
MQRLPNKFKLNKSNLHLFLFIVVVSLFLQLLQSTTLHATIRPEILKIFDNLSPNATLLNLSSKNIKDDELPEILAKISNEMKIGGKLTQLKELDLYNNQLTTLPPAIGTLTRLKELYLSSNKLTTLPPEFGTLTQLNKLYLSSNQLTTLPPEFGALTQLNTLYLSGNQLTTLPPVLKPLFQRLNMYNSYKNLFGPGYDTNGFSELGIHKDTGLFFNKDGYDCDGYNIIGFNREAIHKVTGTKYNERGFDKDGKKADGSSGTELEQEINRRYFSLMDMMYTRLISDYEKSGKSEKSEKIVREFLGVQKILEERAKENLNLSKTENGKVNPLFVCGKFPYESTLSRNVNKEYPALISATEWKQLKTEITGAIDSVITDFENTGKKDDFFVGCKLHLLDKVPSTREQYPALVVIGDKLYSYVDGTEKPIEAKKEEILSKDQLKLLSLAKEIDFSPEQCRDIAKKGGHAFEYSLYHEARSVVARSILALADGDDNNTSKQTLRKRVKRIIDNIKKSNGAPTSAPAPAPTPTLRALAMMGIQFYQNQGRCGDGLSNGLAAIERDLIYKNQGEDEANEAHLLGRELANILAKHNLNFLEKHAEVYPNSSEFKTTNPEVMKQRFIGSINPTCDRREVLHPDFGHANNENFGLVETINRLLNGGKLTGGEGSKPVSFTALDKTKLIQSLKNAHKKGKLSLKALKDFATSDPFLQEEAMKVMDEENKYTSDYIAFAGENMKYVFKEKFWEHLLLQYGLIFH